MGQESKLRDWGRERQEVRREFWETQNNKLRLNYGPEEGHLSKRPRRAPPTPKTPY